jgi:hypothetical protein
MLSVYVLGWLVVVKPGTTTSYRWRSCYPSLTVEYTFFTAWICTGRRRRRTMVTTRWVVLSKVGQCQNGWAVWQATPACNLDACSLFMLLWHTYTSHTLAAVRFLAQEEAGDDDDDDEGEVRSAPTLP